MEASRQTALLGHLDELETRDRALAGFLAELIELTEEVCEIRRRASEISAALERLPDDRVSAERECRSAERVVAEALRARSVAEAALADLERARRPNAVALRRVHRELGDAVRDLDDATARAERADRRREELVDVEVALRASADGLVAAARALASRLEAAPRLSDAGKGAPGATLGELEGWGAQARAALFLAHATLVAERERVLLEANALGASVDDATASLSIALVRRRLLESR